MAGSLFFFGGAIVTCEDAPLTAETTEAVLVTDGQIAAVGTENELRPTARAVGAEEVDLAGRALLPGFIDAHHHFLFAALDRRSTDLRLPAGTSIDDMLGLVEQFAAHAPNSGWVRLFGYSPTTLRERRHPTRHELDRACPERPLFIGALGWHSGALNSAGFDAMGWLPPTTVPIGGGIPLGRDRLPRGDISEAALFLAEAQSRNSLVGAATDSWLTEAAAHAQELLMAGITRVGDAAVSPLFDDLYQRAIAGGLLPLTVHRMPIGNESLLAHRTSGPATGSGPTRSPVGAAKLFLDGGEACAVCLSVGELLQAVSRVVRTSVGGGGLASMRAALHAARNGGPARFGRDRKYHHGLLFWDDDDLAATIASAADHGLQVAQHAIGNEAIDQATRALSKFANRLDELPGRPRLEHTVFCGAELAGRIADVGAIAVVSPIWVQDLGPELFEAPAPPSLPALPLKTLTAAGVQLAGSSDYPSGDYRVLPAIQAAVTRRARSGVLYSPHEALTVGQALHAYTTGSAAALGVSHAAGSITVGKQADLVVIDRNPADVEPENIGSLAVEETYVAGICVYQARPQRKLSQRPPSDGSTGGQRV
ncbi:amidohydrolase [Mycolicibacterium stellerae]|uniref:amidohydrolase n=1 Tax=Mycolicibacterium stellerae TaxID=2358193 RepID=UPI000F0B6367|nr:amidohydrolase family protein [Mycolicibacterium stellerae]